MSESSRLIPGAKSGISYPLEAVYCGNCSMPIEYCEYYPEYEKCKQWLERHLPSEFEKIKLSDEAPEGAGDEEKKRQKRGGKGMMKAKKKEDGPKQVCVSRAPRGKKKSVTVVTGLSSFGIDLKVAAKFFGTKFACGSSVTGDDEIVIQGDVKDDLFDVIPEKWPEGTFRVPTYQLFLISLIFPGWWVPCAIDFKIFKGHQVLKRALAVDPVYNIGNHEIDEDLIEDLGDQKR